MQLEPVERDVRIEQRIVVVESGDEADGELTGGHGVDEGAAELFVTQRIAERVDDGSRCEPVRRNFPQFPESYGELLRLPATPQFEASQQFFRQIPAHPVAEDRQLRVNVDARL